MSPCKEILTGFGSPTGLSPERGRSAVRCAASSDRTPGSRGLGSSDDVRNGDDSVVCQPVFGTGTAETKSFPVLGRPIPLVLVEPVSRKASGQLRQEPVSID